MYLKFEKFKHFKLPHISLSVSFEASGIYYDLKTWSVKYSKLLILRSGKEQFPQRFRLQNSVIIYAVSRNVRILMELRYEQHFNKTQHLFPWMGSGWFILRFCGSFIIKKCCFLCLAFHFCIIHHSFFMNIWDRKNERFSIHNNSLSGD